MKVKAWGTRGSIAICNEDSVVTGGNTTCFEVISDCWPSGTKFMLDAGTGFVPAGNAYLPDFFSGKIPNLKYVIAFTHWHFDHILGLTISPNSFIPNIPMTMYGPLDNGVGVKEMMQTIFNRPFFPVDIGRISHKMTYKTLFNYDVHVIVAHPKGGFTTIKMERYERFMKGDKMIPIGQGKYHVNECMVITMTPANHTNSNCISYRFEEKPTGKVFVFLTDHEDTSGISMDLKRHVSNADLLVIDAQYDDTSYHAGGKSGFGHGTPYYAMKLGVICNVKNVGLTHHEPTNTDQQINTVILPEAKKALSELLVNKRILKNYKVDASKVSLTEDNIFLCKDYELYNV